MSGKPSPAAIKAAQEAAVLAALRVKPGASVYELSLLVPREDQITETGAAPAPGAEDDDGLFPAAEVTLHTPATAATCGRVLALLKDLERRRLARCDRSGLHRWYLAG